MKRRALVRHLNLEALKEARQQADKAAAYLASDGIPDFLIE